MQKLSTIRFMLGLLAGILILRYGSLPVMAIGPGTGGSKIRIDDEHIGPYILLSATSPLPVTVGQMSVWVRVTGIADNQLRRDARVIVTANLRGSDAPPVTAEGTHKNAGNNFDYVAHLPIDQPGQWDITLTVSDELGNAEASFSETVTAQRDLKSLLIIAIPFVIVAGGVGLYLWRRAAPASSMRASWMRDVERGTWEVPGSRLEA